MSRTLLFFFSLSILIIVACSDGNKKPQPEIIETIYPDSLLAWKTNFDSMLMVRDRMIPDSALTISRIVNGLNQAYPQVRVNVIKQSDDTLFVEIPDANYLGEQMGDAGASAWFADAAINLTSVAGVEVVSFKMDDHSHAGSTVISRKQFNKWIKQ